MYLFARIRYMVIFGVAITSCLVCFSCKREKTDKCTNVVCTNGKCVDGVCICNTGYDGAQCDSEIRRKFLYHWYALDTITTTNIPETEYFSLISTDTSITGVIIQSMFDDYCWNISATIKNDSVIVTDGNLCDSNKLSGYGILKGNYLYWHYSLVTAKGDTIQYRGTWQGY